MAAFEAARAAGFAIECDVQLTADGQAVVFHDARLDRLTALSGAVALKTASDLAQVRLLGTADTIRTLGEHMDRVAGAVPVIVELKGVGENAPRLVDAVARALDGYRGPVAVMSFDHSICELFRSVIPAIPRGLTAEGDESTHGAHRHAMETFDLQFASYDVNAVPNAFTDSLRRAGTPVLTWTVRTQQQAERSFRYADQMTFEGFDPRHGDR